MKNLINWAILMVLAIMVCGCNNPEDKVKNAVIKYQEEGYTILSQSENPSKVDHFVLVQKDNQIYFDGLSGRKSKYLVFPKEDGYYLKQVQLSLKDSIPVCSFALLNEGNKLIMSGEEYVVIKDDKLKGKQTFVFANKNAINSPCYTYCLSNPDTLFALGTWKGIWIEKDQFIIQYCESLDKLFGENYKNNVFDVVMYLSTEDMSFIGFYGSFGLDAKYDLDYIKNKYPGKEFKDQNNEIRFPFSWFGSPDIKTIKEAIDNYEWESNKVKREIDRLLKDNELAKRQLNQNNRNCNSNSKGNRIQWYVCPYCFGKGYHEGHNVSGRRTRYRCSGCGGAGGHWE